MADFSRQFSYPEIILHNGKKYEVTDSRSIVHVAASKNYCRIHFDNGKTMVVAKILSYFEERLAGKGFIRIHHGHIVNMNHIMHVA